MVYVTLALLIISSFACRTISFDFEIFSTFHPQLASAINISTQRFGIMPVTALGLANRLRIIASLYTISKAYDMNLIIIWGPDVDCACQFSDLFTHTGITIISIKSALDNSPDFERMIRYSLSTISRENSMPLSEVHLRNFNVPRSTFAGQLNLVWTRGTHAPASMPCGDYLYSKSLFYRQLQPTSDVLAVIQRVNMQRESGLIVGVHVRAFDVEYDWPVVSPTVPTDFVSNERSANKENQVLPQLHSKRFDESSTLESFVLLMDSLVLTNPEIQFFVASNSIKAKLWMEEKYGSSRIITLHSEETGRRSHHDGMVVAAAEFLLLAETAFVVHSRGSSFAREAAVKYMIPVIDVCALQISN
jgi:hypothetical protein